MNRNRYESLTSGHTPDQRGLRPAQLVADLPCVSFVPLLLNVFYASCRDSIPKFKTLVKGGIGLIAMRLRLRSKWGFPGPWGYRLPPAGCVTRETKSKPHRSARLWEASSKLAAIPTSPQAPHLRCYVQIRRKFKAKKDTILRNALDIPKMFSDFVRFPAQPFSFHLVSVSFCSSSFDHLGSSSIWVPCCGAMHGFPSLGGITQICICTARFATFCHVLTRFDTSQQSDLLESV